MLVENKMLLGVDTGGTFTDFVLLANNTIRVHKVLSTPHAPEIAILQGIADLELSSAISAGKLRVIHGSTVATNAALEGKGVRTVFVTNRGFKDMLTIARQTRRELYNLQPPIIPPPVSSDLCIEVNCRRDALGNIVTPLTEQEMQRLVADINTLQPESVAINLLFSYLNSHEEEQIAKALGDNFFISRSSFVLPEYKEYERGIATWLNAYLGPLMQRYLSSLASALKPSPLAVMQSSGGTIDADQASQRAVNLLLSGPAGGLAAAKFMRNLGIDDNLLTFDMGGTSTDVAMLSGELRITNEGSIGPFPVAVPMVDMHTIGAGGGSIASVDLGGLLQVGPQSAGASPGPACYGKGGTQATVTDANALLGRLQAEHFLGGTMSLNVEAARTVIGDLASQLHLSHEDTALGIIQLANEHMSRALRIISVQRGHDPQHFRLCCFGGAGGLHVCELAENLGMNKALVPQYGGVLSALGMLVAPRERQVSLTHQAKITDVDETQLQQWLEQLFDEGSAALRQEEFDNDIAQQELREQMQLQQQPSLDLRYRGQSYSLNVPFTSLQQTVESFHQLHQQRYGHRLNRDVELVNLRQRVFIETDDVQLPEIAKRPAEEVLHTQTVRLFGLEEVKLVLRDSLYQGDQLAGPLLICEQVATTLVLREWSVEVDKYGNLLLNKTH